MIINTVGSVCSGIEAASVAWEPMGLSFKWFSEIADFPSSVLQEKYPNVPNLGDMNIIPQALLDEKIVAPDLICGGTPCQAFSLAGWKNGLNDDRGNLTLKFVDIVDANDEIRIKKGLEPSIVFWENVEGVLSDKTNAFGCLLSSLAGLNEEIQNKRWPNSGVIRGPKRNVAWRVLDAKYFGVPHQRRRLYLLAGGKNFHPENVLFERHENELLEFPKSDLLFTKDDIDFEIFREYTDCLYAAYGTKWNGNAAAYNGSLFVAQDNRIRRLSPLECERLMGFPDNYTNIAGAKRTNRYQVIGNSWAVPVIKWIGKRLLEYSGDELSLDEYEEGLFGVNFVSNGEGRFWDFGKDILQINSKMLLNCTSMPENPTFTKLQDVITHIDVPKGIYISPVGCAGIVRRKTERKLSMNQRLENILSNIANTWTEEEIEKKSRTQKRGRFSLDEEEDKVPDTKIDNEGFKQLDIFG